jgi:DNA polymerase-3 subunit delta'
MWSIIGDAAVLAALDRAIESGRPAHAWLFTGPEGIGKRAVAIEFAAALNCKAERAALDDGQSGEGAAVQINPKPCGGCRSCRDTFAGQHADVEFVAPGGVCDEPGHADHGDSRNLRICQVRRLERVLSLSPYAGGRRVAIVEAADSLQVEAANAFLKTLEEPPEGTVIILLAEAEDKLPETVLSRCQRLAFRPLDRQTIEAALQARGADEATVESIAAAANGRIGWALRALADPALLAERSSMVEDAVRLAHAGRIERFAWARGAENRGNEVKERYLRELSVWEGWWRSVLQAGAGPVEAVDDPLLAAEGKLYTSAEIVRFLKALLKTREYLQANVDPQLALENLMLDLPIAGGSARTLNARA